MRHRVRQGLRFRIRLGQILVEILVADALKLCARQDGKQLPANIQRFFNGAVRVIALRNIFRFKRVRKLCVKLIRVGKRRVAQNDGKLFRILTAGICAKSWFIVSA